MVMEQAMEVVVEELRCQVAGAVGIEPGGGEDLMMPARARMGPWSEMATLMLAC